MSIGLRTDLQKQILIAGFVVAAGIGNLMSPAGTGSVLVLGGGLLILAFIAPVWALFLFGFMLPFEQPRELAGWGTVYTGEMLLVACLPGIIWNIGKKQTWQDVAHPVAIWILPFTVIIVLSAFYAATPVAMKGTLRWLEFILVLIMGVHILRQGQEAERVLWALMIAAMISALQGVFQTGSGGFTDPQSLKVMTSQGEVIRAGAGFGANTLAVFLGMLLPFAIMAALFHPQGWGRLLGLIGSFIMTAGFLLTFSLTGLVVILTVLIIFLIYICLHSFRFTLWFITFSSLSFVVLMLCQPALFSGPFWQTKLASAQDRFAYAAVCGQLLMQSPWLGIGPGMYRFLAPVLAEGDINPVGLITHPHSLWLTVLVETGICGLAAIIFAGIRGARVIFQDLRQLGPGWPTAAGWALAAGLAGFALANLTEHCLIHDRGMHTALIIAATLVIVRRPSRPAEMEQKHIFETIWQNEKKEDWEKLLAERKGARQPLYELLEKALFQKSCAKIIEIGCGPALDALVLAKDKQREVHALDCSANALKLATAAARQLKRSLKLHHADVRRTGLPAASFDLVFSQGLLEHFPDPQPVWTEMNRLLKPGGFIVVDVPQTLNPYTLIKFWHQWLGDWPWGWETQYTLGDLRSAASQFNLRLIAARGYGYREGPADITAWIRKLFQPCFPEFWKKLERSTGAWWMMNVVVLLQKPEEDK